MLKKLLLKKVVPRTIISIVLILCVDGTGALYGFCSFLSGIIYEYSLGQGICYSLKVPHHSFSGIMVGLVVVS